MEQYFIWAQISGFIAMCFSITAWQFKKQEHIVMCYIPSSFFWSIQYFLLSVPNAALFALSCILKDSALVKLSEQYLKYVVLTFFLLNLAFLIPFYKTIFDLLPLIIILLVNLPLLKKDNRYWVARGNIAAQLGWIAFNLYAGAFMGIICACFIIASTFIGMARYERWNIGKCYRSFAPSVMRSLLLKPQTYP